jgi:hypothetical protein
MSVPNSKLFKIKHGISPSEGLSLEEISKLSGMPKAALQEVFDKGVGAYKTNPSSVRPSVNSPEQWAFGRVYSFVMKRKTTFGGVDKHIAEKYNITR